MPLPIVHNGPRPARKSPPPQARQQCSQPPSAYAHSTRTRRASTQARPDGSMHHEQVGRPPAMPTRLADRRASACIRTTTTLPLTYEPMRRKTRTSSLWLTLMTLAAAALLTVFYTLVDGHARTTGLALADGVKEVLKRLYDNVCMIEWKRSASFHVTDAMRLSIALSMALGVLLGTGVGIISGLEPAVVIGVSASMAMGCVFVISFAILHGVSAIRSVTFALFVSTCLPLGFGLGFGIGILIAVFLGLEDADDIREKTGDFVNNFPDFVRVVAAFTLEIL